MQIEVKTVHYVEAEWFCKEVVKAICSEENQTTIEAACKAAKIRPQHLNWFLWNLITDMHFKQEVLGGDYFELHVFSETQINKEAKFSASSTLGKLIRLLLDSYVSLLKEVKSYVGSDKVLIGAPKGTFLTVEKGSNHA